MQGIYTTDPGDLGTRPMFFVSKSTGSSIIYPDTIKTTGYIKGEIILANTSIGIGTTNPTEKLEVVGTIKASSFKVNGWELGATPDYVFKEDYKLRSLQEVELFVKANNHLPDVPDARTMKDEGVDLAQMNMILLKKVEELTLYSIEQNKTLLDQNKKIAQQHKNIELLMKALKLSTKK